MHSIVSENMVIVFVKNRLQFPHIYYSSQKTAVSSHNKKCFLLFLGYCVSLLLRFGNGQVLFHIIWVLSDARTKRHLTYANCYKTSKFLKIDHNSSQLSPILK